MSNTQKCCSREPNMLIIHVTSNPVSSTEANKWSCTNSSDVHWSCPPMYFSIPFSTVIEQPNKFFLLDFFFLILQNMGKGRWFNFSVNSAIKIGNVNSLVAAWQVIIDCVVFSSPDISISMAKVLGFHKQIDLVYRLRNPCQVATYAGMQARLCSSPTEEKQSLAGFKNALAD